MAFRVKYRGSQVFNLGPLSFLIVANLILFVATLVRRDLFIGLFGLSGYDFLSQPWTIVTNMFIHASFGHVFFNMLTLYFYGSYLIDLVGEKKFLIVYFIGGLLGNVAYLLLASPLSIAIGASGAIFAVGGALAVLRPRMTVYLFPIPVPLPLWVVVIGGFLVISPGIAWQAHLGGLVFGLVAGFFFRRWPAYSRR
jgi:membrane associated rhomboid family serine protease